MKPAKKIYVVLCLAVLVAVACGPVTPIPLRQVTETLPVQTEQLVTITPTVILEERVKPSSSFQLGNLLPPSKPITEYELHAWTQEFSNSLKDNLDSVESDFYRYYREYNSYHAALSAEGWLRSNSEGDKNNWLCDIVNHNPGTETFPNLRPGQDLFSFFVEDLLNNKGVSVDDLPQKFRDSVGTSECLSSFSLNASGNVFFEPALVQNLFGDGQVSYVFAVGTLFTENRIAVYATHSVEGQIRVEKIRDWEEYFSALSSYEIRLIDIGDLNNNGRNEIVAQVNYGGSGFPTQGAEWIYRYEWDTVSNSFLGGQKITIFAQECYVGACYGTWEFKHISNSSDLILTTQEYFNTNIDVCEYVIRERIYLLQDNTLLLQSDTLLMPENNLPVCQIAWAYEILTKPNGWKNDRAIDIISDALSDWPNEMNTIWGKNSQSYFQLMLGIWRDLRGENEQSIVLFESLASLQDPSNPSFIGQLAKVYLNARQQKGIVVACSEMNTLQEDLLFERYSEQATQYMGFGRNRWPTFVDDFCDESAVLPAAIQTSDKRTFDIVNTDDLEKWLELQGKEDIYIRKVEADHQEVWVASFLNRKINHYDINIYQLWAFRKTSIGLNAVYLNEIRLDMTKIVLSERYNEKSINLDVFQPEKNVHIALIKFDDCLEFLDISLFGKMNLIETICGAELFYSIKQGEVNILIEDYYPVIWKPVSYQWNYVTKSLDKVEPSSYNFPDALKQADMLIYQDQNYSDAIVHINNILLFAPPERVIAPLCEKLIADDQDKDQFDAAAERCGLSLEWYKPYLSYHLGIAYEMAGHLDLAKSTFYTLWKEYPNNFFGLAAAHRLTPITP